MKKILPITLLTICMCSTLLTSCNKNDTPKLTYGSLIAQDSYGLGGVGGYHLTYAQLKEKMKNKETMLVVIFPGLESTCGCWITFQRVIKRYIENTNNKVYCINYFDMVASNDTYGFEGYSDSPTFHIVHNESIIFKSSYKNDSHDIYTSENLLKQTVDKYVTSPSMYEISLNEIEEVANYETSRIFFSRSTCGDCNYVIPNLLVPYFNSSTSNERLYIFDMDALRSNQDVYQNFKDNYGLSYVGNETYGYGVGYVPTFQYLENGAIKSAAVYFNDTVVKTGDGQYEVITSYYTEDRLNNLSYLKDSNVENKILEGLKLGSDDVFEIPMENDETYIGWHKEKAAKYHDPILTSFLDSCFK